VNYFEIKHPLNASLPMDGTPAAIYRKTMRACFPGGGVEVELEDTPVFECSRWDPDQTRLVTLRITRSEYLKSEQGVAYTRELEAWEAARKRDADELQAALDSDDPPAPPPSVLVAMRAELAEGGEHDCLMLYKAGKFIRKITTTDTEASLSNLFGEGHYQLRLVRYKNRADDQGVVAAIRTIDLEAV